MRDADGEIAPGAHILRSLQASKQARLADSQASKQDVLTTKTKNPLLKG